MSSSSGGGRRPRVLYIAFYFPPTRASGVYRSRATANHLARQGWDVTVVTPQRSFFTEAIRSFDPSLEDTVDPRVDVQRVTFPASSWERDIRQWGWFRGHFPAIWNKWHRWVNARLFPEQYASWIPRVVRAGLAMHARSRFDVILATGNPHASFAAAWMLKRATGVPYVVDYRDAWTLNLFDDVPAFPPESPNWDWERRVIRDASAVVFVNDALREWHARRYPQQADRMLVVQNGWEPEFLEELAPAPHAAGEGPVFGYLGTVTSKVPLEPFFDGWRLALADPLLKGARVRLYGHLGFFPQSVQGLRDALPLDEGIGLSYEGPVAKAEIADVYAACDVLLLLIAGSKYVTSGKVYEYMATGRPIVSVHEPECAASDTLRGYPLWFPVESMAPEAIRDALVAAAKAAAALTPEDVHACREHALRYTRDAQLAGLVEVLQSLVRR